MMYPAVFSKHQKEKDMPTSYECSTAYTGTWHILALKVSTRLDPKGHKVLKS